MTYYSSVKTTLNYGYNFLCMYSLNIRKLLFFSCVDVEITLKDCDILINRLNAC